MARRSTTPVPVGEEDSNLDEELPEEGKSEIYRSTGVENVDTPLHPPQLTRPPSTRARKGGGFLLLMSCSISFIRSVRL